MNPFICCHHYGWILGMPLNLFLNVACMMRTSVIAPEKKKKSIKLFQSNKFIPFITKEKKKDYNLKRMNTIVIPHLLLLLTDINLMAKVKVLFVKVEGFLILVKDIIDTQ